MTGFKVTAYQYVQDAIANAYHSGLTISDLVDVVEDSNVQSCESFNEKVSTICSFQTKVDYRD